MRRHGFKLIALMAVAAMWWAWRGYATSRNATEDGPHKTKAQLLAEGGSGTAAAAAEGIPTRVRKVSVEDRRRMQEQIVAARAVRAAKAAAANGKTGAEALPTQPAPVEDDHTHDLDKLSQPVMDALQQAIPFLAACYEQQGSAKPAAGDTAVALLTLTNDPDIGAVIDTDQILDDQKAPLDPEVDACLRSTMQTLELPPLDAGDTVKLQYSFRFGSGS